MIHIILHFLVPVLIAYVFYRRRLWWVTVILIATMIVDLDHLMANPIYDPERCSIGYHPLHSLPAVFVYLLLFLLPLLPRKVRKSNEKPATFTIVHLIGLGLLIHMALDWIDCLL